ncbi:hypothetical protein GCM10010435_57630 [Winogradskya consettensis]|uniref:RNA polymerase sigma-70 region 2 domain-containing protein n=1 Tax=Winogradskya consettensis TaxID=113560 RepID=A0A919VL29_9ACTN|nr:sigma factor [Actinoplanes consettensis]GIM67081.1 hypothetical protein Aco04nite_04690 [Actinoplanes consettensis]
MTMLSDQSLHQSLVSRIAAGDPAALRMLYGALCEAAYREIQRVLSHPHDVEAVVQATFVEVWWLARYHTQNDDIPAWVTAVAAHRAAERHRVVTSGAHLEEEDNRLILTRILG